MEEEATVAVAKEAVAMVREVVARARAARARAQESPHPKWSRQCLRSSRAL